MLISRLCVSFWAFIVLLCRAVYHFTDRQGVMSDGDCRMCRDLLQIPYEFARWTTTKHAVFTFVETVLAAFVMFCEHVKCCWCVTVFAPTSVVLRLILCTIRCTWRFFTNICEGGCVSVFTNVFSFFLYFCPLARLVFKKLRTNFHGIFRDGTMGQWTIDKIFGYLHPNPEPKIFFLYTNYCTTEVYRHSPGDATCPSQLCCLVFNCS